MTHSLAILDDDPNILDALCTLFGAAGYAVTTYASSRRLLMEIDSQTSCALVDLRMPGMGGIEVTREIQQRKLFVPVIVMTGHADVPSAVQAIKAGAQDFVEKPLADSILATVERVIGQTLSRRFRPLPQDIAPKKLTDRELHILEEIVSGKSSKMLAAQLQLSQRTIETHRHNIMRKLGVHNAAAMTRMALAVLDS